MANADASLRSGSVKILGRPLLALCHDRNEADNSSTIHACLAQVLYVSHTVVLWCVWEGRPIIVNSVPQCVLSTHFEAR